MDYNWNLPEHSGYSGYGSSYPQYLSNSTPRGGNNDRSRLANEAQYQHTQLRQSPFPASPDHYHAPHGVHYQQWPGSLEPNEVRQAAIHNHVEPSNFDLGQLRSFSRPVHEPPLFLAGPGRIHDHDQQTPLHRNRGQSLQAAKAHTVPAGPVSPELLHAHYLSSNVSPSFEDSGFESVDGSSQPFVNAQSDVFEFRAGGRSAYDTGPVDSRHHRPTSVVSEPQLRSAKGPLKRGKSGPPTPCSECGKETKNQSEAQKHRQQHEKGNKCSFPGCKRAKEGFATYNDLQRHRKSVHGLTPMVGKSTGHICRACEPPPPGAAPKWWPRLDNFAAHVRRKHQDWDEAHLVEISETARPDNAVSESGYSSQHPSAALESHEQLDTFPSPVSSSFQMHDAYGTSTTPMNVDNANLNTLAGIGAGPMAGPLITHDMAALHFNGISPLDTNATLLCFGNPAQQDASPVDSHIASPAIDRMGPPPVMGITEFGFDGQPPAFRGVVWQDIQIQEPVPSPALVPRPTTNLRNSLSANRTADGQYACSDCEKTFSRECDLRKHIKRHIRGYGCTFPDCYKHFGSRHDWKRHECGQHRPKEKWLYEPLEAERAINDQLLHSKPTSAALIQLQHSMVADTRDGHMSSAIRANSEASNHFFWCGFCEKLIPLDRGLRDKDLQESAWKCRIQHIGDHYDKGGANTDEWLCIEHNKTKGEMDERHLSTSQLGDADDGSDLGDDGILYPVAMTNSDVAASGLSNRGPSTSAAGEVFMLSDIKSNEVDTDVDAHGDSDPGY